MNSSSHPNELAISNFLDLDHTDCSAVFQEGTHYPWDGLEKLDSFFSKLKATSGPFIKIGNPYIGEDVIIGEGTIIEEGAMILGPAWIGHHCLIRHGAYIRDHCFIGNEVVIGNTCEIKKSILFDRCQVPHFNYVGDSILGYCAHLGAGVKISNVKLLPGEIVVQCCGKKIPTQLEKFGAIVGDHAQIGCNAVLNPGSLIGRHSVIYPNTNWRGYLPPHNIARQDSPLVVHPLKQQTTTTNK